MSDVTIIQLSRKELDEMISSAMDAAIDRARQELTREKDPREEEFLSSAEICELMKISRFNTFEKIKGELITAGMFQLDARGTYRMKKIDFENWLHQKRFPNKKTVG
jgi:hypothetical protein